LGVDERIGDEQGGDVEERREKGMGWEEWGGEEREWRRGGGREEEAIRLVILNFWPF